MDRMGLDRLAAPMDRMGLDRMGAAANSMDRMGPALSQGMGAGLDRIGLPMGSTFERAMDMERGNFAAGNFTSSGNRGPAAAGVARKACQIFVRNLPFDFTWKMLKDKFNECGTQLHARHQNGEREVQRLRSGPVRVSRGGRASLPDDEWHSARGSELMSGLTECFKPFFFPFFCGFFFKKSVRMYDWQR
ncbi:putative Heterogeneous nuclear ribonucleoprotein [Naja naja]|nr:putative Heterogeneous nuclear ribonucleoprotein [Naja naja]